MGKAIFQTEIIELGEQVDAFFEEGMFVLFGDNVPDTLKDFCHFIDQKKVCLLYTSPSPRDCS